MSAIAISGPTTENNEKLNVFEWKKADPHNYVKREGLPEKYQYPYILVNPKTLCTNDESDIYEFVLKKKK